MTCKYDTPMDNSDNCNVDCATNGVLNISNCSKCFALSNTVVKCQICDTNYKMNSLGVCIDVAAAALACQSD